jgi:hypothetical protein
LGKRKRLAVGLRVTHSVPGHIPRTVNISISIVIWARKSLRPSSGRARLSGRGLDIAAGRALSPLSYYPTAVWKLSSYQLARKLPKAAAEADPISLNLHVVFYV